MYGGKGGTVKKVGKKNLLIEHAVLKASSTDALGLQKHEQVGPRAN